MLRVAEGDKLLFLRDAKGAKNETSRRRDTAVRIQGYIHEFADLLPTYRGGTIAIATNDEAAAQDGAGALSLLARFARIVGPLHSPPAIKVEKIDQRTWIAWW